jgi:diguanylate cyclase (GGDEF)-like protein
MRPVRLTRCTPRPFVSLLLLYLLLLGAAQADARPGGGGKDAGGLVTLALVARVASQTQLQQLLFAAPVVIDQSLEHKVAERTQQLELANRRLREEKVTLEISSITEGLTGLYNRTYVLDRFEKELAASRRYDKLLSVIMFDLDHFKRVNDAYGHQVGDAVMQRVTAIFKAVIRESDLAGRYGGEEFLIVLPETDCGEAAVVAERIRAQVEALQWTEPGLRPTISGGVAESSGETADRLLQRADSLLYRAKELGRNRIISQAEAYPRLVDRAT